MTSSFVEKLENIGRNSKGKSLNKSIWFVESIF